MTLETASPGNATAGKPQRHANHWVVLLLVFTLAGVVESQAFGHLNAFRPLYLQQLGVPAPNVPTWTGVLAALGFVIGLPLLPFWGVWTDLTQNRVPSAGRLPGHTPVLSVLR